MTHPRVKRRTRRVVAVVLAGVVLLIGAAGVAFAVMTKTVSGCAVETCSLGVTMKGSATRNDAEAARTRYLAIAGVHAGPVEFSAVSTRKRTHGHWRLVRVDRYTFYVTDPGKDPVELDIKDRLIASTIEPI